jgi:hypothetical protein
VEDSRSAFIISTVKPTVKRALGRPRDRCEDNIRMGLKGVGINTSSWIDPDQDMGLLESSRECGIRPASFISNGVSKIV